MKEGNYKRIKTKLWHHSNIIKLNVIVASEQHSLYTSLWEENQRHIEAIASNVPWLEAIHMPPAALTITVANLSYSTTSHNATIVRSEIKQARGGVGITAQTIR